MHFFLRPLRFLDGLEQLLAQDFDFQLSQAEFLPESFVIFSLHSFRGKPFSSPTARRGLDTAKFFRHLEIAQHFVFVGAEEERGLLGR